MLDDGVNRVGSGMWLFVAAVLCFVGCAGGGEESAVPSRGRLPAPVVTAQVSEVGVRWSLSSDAKAQVSLEDVVLAIEQYSKQSRPPEVVPIVFRAPAECPVRAFELFLEAVYAPLDGMGSEVVVELSGPEDNSLSFPILLYPGAGLSWQGHSPHSEPEREDEPRGYMSEGADVAVHLLYDGRCYSAAAHLDAHRSVDCDGRFLEQLRSGTVSQDELDALATLLSERLEEEAGKLAELGLRPSFVSIAILTSDGKAVTWGEVIPMIAAVGAMNKGKPQGQWLRVQFSDSRP